MHPEHLLCLYSRPQDKLWSSCNACHGVKHDQFIYQCLDCKFNICLTCSLQDRGSIHHQGHKQHSLSLVNRRASFECDACGTQDNDYSYICDSCPFWIHRSCATSPTTFISSFHHQHPLLLDYSLPQRYRNFLSFCSICKKKLNPMHWLYYCLDCRIFAHLKCASLRYNYLSVTFPNFLLFVFFFFFFPELYICPSKLFVNFKIDSQLSK